MVYDLAAIDTRTHGPLITGQSRKAARRRSSPVTTSWKSSSNSTLKRPASRIFWKMTALWKPLSGSPATPIDGPRNSMTAADKRFYRGYGEDSILKKLLRKTGC